MSESRVAIVGGGVSGLATAYFLRQRHTDAILFEKSERLGGLIKTDLYQNCRLEAGPDSYIATKPAVTELAHELGDLGNQILPANDAERRIFIFRAGELLPLPPGMSMMVPGQLAPALESKLFDSETKRRFIEEQSFEPLTRSEDVSIGQLVLDHFGAEVLEYVADPLLVGVYGGETSELSAESVLPRFLGFEQRYGSLIKGVHEEVSATPAGGLFLSLRDGMQSLTDSLAPSAAVVQHEVCSVRWEGSRWLIRAGEDSYRAEHLVLACPAHACARLLEGEDPDLAAELSAIPYSSCLVATLLYDAASVAHPLNGFGFLMPRSERRTVAAATWINTKFPSRVAHGLVAIRAFVVGREASGLLAASDQEIVSLVAEELRRVMDIDAAPLHSLIYRWPHSMPQYVVGHKRRQARIKALVDSHRGLSVVGNAYDGVGIPDCVRLARQAALRIAAEIKS